MLPELPYHRFSNGDGILVVSTLPNGELPKADLSQASRAPQQHFSLLFWRPCVHVLHSLLQASSLPETESTKCELMALQDAVMG